MRVKNSLLELQVPQRTITALRRAGLLTTTLISDLTEKELGKKRGISPKMAGQIREEMERLGKRMRS